jgi:3-hydroxyisobutyrate dehydrogenase
MTSTGRRAVRRKAPPEATAPQRVCTPVHGTNAPHRGTSAATKSPRPSVDRDAAAVWPGPVSPLAPPAPVGVAGCGTMGRLLVTALHASGYPVVAYDPDPQARTAAIEAGATAVPTLDDLGSRVVAVVLSLPGPAEIVDVVGRLLARPGSVQVIIDTSTSDPATSRSLAARATAAHIGYLDAPILGRPATAGRWTVPVGGEAAVLERARPVLEAFAASIVHVGPAGAGHTVKLLNQMMFAVINAATAELMAAAPRVGIAPALLYQAIVSSGAATVSGLFREAGGKIARADFSPVFSIDLLCKDTDLAVRMARAAGAAPVLTTMVQVLNHLARAGGLGGLDSAALVQVYARLAQPPAEEPRDAGSP